MSNIHGYITVSKKKGYIIGTHSIDMMYCTDHQTNIDIILKHIEVLNYIGYTWTFLTVFLLTRKIIKSTIKHVS